MPQFFFCLCIFEQKHFLLMWEHVKTILLACFIVFWVPSWVLRQKFVKICEFYFVVTWHASFFFLETRIKQMSSDDYCSCIKRHFYATKTICCHWHAYMLNTSVNEQLILFKVKSFVQHQNICCVWHDVVLGGWLNFRNVSTYTATGNGM